MIHRIFFWELKIRRHIYFWPLLIMAGRIVHRMVLNLWNMVEPGGAY